MGCYFATAVNARYRDRPSNALASAAKIEHPRRTAAPSAQLPGGRALVGHTEAKVGFEPKVTNAALPANGRKAQVATLAKSAIRPGHTASDRCNAA